MKHVRICYMSRLISRNSISILTISSQCNRLSIIEAISKTRCVIELFNICTFGQWAVCTTHCVALAHSYFQLWLFHGIWPWMADMVLQLQLMLRRTPKLNIHPNGIHSTILNIKIIKCPKVAMEKSVYAENSCLFIGA